MKQFNPVPVLIAMLVGIGIIVPAGAQAKKHSEVKHHITVKARSAAGLGVQVVHVRWNHSMCIGIQGGSISAGAAVRQGACNGASDQKWVFQTTGGGANPSWEMINYKSHLCFDFKGDAFSNGDPIIQWYCNSSDQAQQLGLMSTSGSANGGCAQAYFDIHHWSIYSPYVAAVPGQDQWVAGNLVEWAYSNTPLGNFPPNNAQFYEVPGGC